jgi:hypothetical protein
MVFSSRINVYDGSVCILYEEMTQIHQEKVIFYSIFVQKSNY